MYKAIKYLLLLTFISVNTSIPVSFSAGADSSHTITFTNDTDQKEMIYFEYSSCPWTILLRCGIPNYKYLDIKPGCSYSLVIQRPWWNKKARLVGYRKVRRVHMGEELKVSSLKPKPHKWFW